MVKPDNMVKELHFPLFSEGQGHNTIRLPSARISNHRLSMGALSS